MVWNYEEGPVRTMTVIRITVITIIITIMIIMIMIINTIIIRPKTAKTSKIGLRL